jgi:hypothetical protein
MATERDEFEAAFRLVYGGYLHRGLTRPNTPQMRITPFQLSPAAQVFVALRNKSVVSTLTLVEDSVHGLPMESLFQDEIQAFRHQGLRFAEVSALTHGLPKERLNWEIAETLMSLMAQFAMTRNIDRLLITVCPQHAAFYRRIAFRPFSEVRSYDEVCGRPALPMQADLNRLAVDHPALHERFFSRRFPAYELAPRRMPPALVHHFSGILSAIGTDGAFGFDRSAYQKAG